MNEIKETSLASWKAFCVVFLGIAEEVSVATSIGCQNHFIYEKRWRSNICK